MEILYKKLSQEIQRSEDVKAVKCPCGTDPTLCYGRGEYWIACSVDNCEKQPTTSFYLTVGQAIKAWNDSVLKLYESESEGN